jgi:RimJ/RimL family protein N-acetyltransferase
LLGPCRRNDWLAFTVIVMRAESLTENEMSPSEFSAWHRPALEQEAVKHGLILNALALSIGEHGPTTSYWSLGGPGRCAIRVGHRSIVLGAPDQSGCRKLAELSANTDYPGVIGPDTTAEWFADRARELGVAFMDPELRQICAIGDTPNYPGAPGHARLVTADDATLLVEWLLEFYREAVPNDPAPTREDLERAAGDGRFLFWVDKDQPVSMAAIVRRLNNTAAITGVYTPPSSRGRGYAGSVTAATVARIHAEGYAIAWLYADLANPASNRCYAKIGFRPVCRSSHLHRRGQAISPG